MHAVCHTASAVLNCSYNCIHAGGEAYRMKRVRIWVLLLVLLTGGLNSAVAADRIEWHTYDAGMSRSKFEKKKVFLYFHADWCGYCREMENKTFKDSAVIANLNRNFIPIRVDSDRETAVASLFRVKGLPFLVFLSDSGKQIAYVPGFVTSDQLLVQLNAAMKAADVN